jgi:hypothetical protein
MTFVWVATVGLLGAVTDADSAADGGFTLADCQVSTGDGKATASCPNNIHARVELGLSWYTPEELLAQGMGRSAVELEIDIGGTKRKALRKDMPGHRTILRVLARPEQRRVIWCNAAHLETYPLCLGLLEPLSNLAVQQPEEMKIHEVMVFGSSHKAGDLVSPREFVTAQVSFGLAVGAVKPAHPMSEEPLRIRESVEKGEPVHYDQFGFQDLATGALAPESCAPPDSAPSLPATGLSQPYDPKRDSNLSILTALRPMPAGHVLVKSDFGERLYPTARVRGSFVLSTAIDRVVGQKLLIPFATGEPIRLSALAGFPGAVNHCTGQPASAARK